MKKIIRKFKVYFYEITNNKDKIQEINLSYYRSLGMKIGENLKCYSNLTTPEPYLLELGDDITISGGVCLVTHDNSVCKADKNSTDIFGKIVIGNNCFIGINSTILPGVTLGDNTIVAANSVVTKSFNEGNIVIGGNPARKICCINEYKSKIEQNVLNTDGMDYEEKKEYILKNSKKLVVK